MNKYLGEVFIYFQVSYQKTFNKKSIIKPNDKSFLFQFADWTKHWPNCRQLPHPTTPWTRTTTSYQAPRKSPASNPRLASQKPSARAPPSPPTARPALQRPTAPHVTTRRAATPTVPEATAAATTASSHSSSFTSTADPTRRAASLASASRLQSTSRRTRITW